MVRSKRFYDDFHFSYVIFTCVGGGLVDQIKRMAFPVSVGKNGQTSVEKNIERLMFSIYASIAVGLGVLVYYRYLKKGYFDQPS